MTNKMNERAAKCINCQSEEIYETDDTEHPFACGNCGWWGMTANLVENPHPFDEEDWFSRKAPKTTE